MRSLTVFFFFFNDTATTEIYTLSLHDALPILVLRWLTWVCTLANSTSLANVDLPEPLTQIGRAVQQECRDRSRMPSSACKKKSIPAGGNTFPPEHGNCEPERCVHSRVIFPLSY